MANITHLSTCAKRNCNAILVIFMGRYNLNVTISEQERQILDRYCTLWDRTQSDVIREFISSLQKNIMLNNVK